MLVMSRRKNESLVLDNNVTVTVIDIRGDIVRLGIVCPREYPVHRQEVYEAIHGRSSPPDPPPQPISSEELPFLQAVREAPDDLGVRLIYADWLEERGDLRGEFLRLRCTLAPLRQRDARRKPLAEREEALLRQYGALWRDWLPAILA